MARSNSFNVSENEILKIILNSMLKFYNHPSFEFSNKWNVVRDNTNRLFTAYYAEMDPLLERFKKIADLGKKLSLVGKLKQLPSHNLERRYNFGFHFAEIPNKFLLSYKKNEIVCDYDDDDTMERFLKDTETCKSYLEEYNFSESKKQVDNDISWGLNLYGN